MKRVFDVFAAFAGLILGSPVFLLISFVIFVSEGRPILFRQLRVGRGGRDFTLLKFRSMKVLRGAEFGQFDVGKCSRVTPVGRVLRATKLDELPQLWNVLRGEMSFVGPRPEIRKWVDLHPNRWRQILTVRPGITDPASIRFRNEEEILSRAEDPEKEYREVILPEKLELYKKYVESATFMGDIALIGRTIQAVIRK